MADFEETLRTVAREAGKLALGELAAYKDQLIEDAQDFARRKKDDLERWSKLLAEGQLDQSEFEMLVLGAKNLLQLRAEAYAGIAKARLQRLRQAILDVVIKAATGLAL